MSRKTATARTGQDRTSLYNEITGKIICELEARCVPWAQPWGTDWADRVRAHHGDRPDHDAEVACAPLSRSHRHERRDAGAVLLRRRQLDLCRAIRS